MNKQKYKPKEQHKHQQLRFIFTSSATPAYLFNQQGAGDLFHARARTSLDKLETPNAHRTTDKENSKFLAFQLQGMA
jgi:hypothetical protein